MTHDDMLRVADLDDPERQAAIARTARTEPYARLLEQRATRRHVGHHSRLTGEWWCDTCDSPYCELA